jgi:hypothetical protein
VERSRLRPSRRWRLWCDQVTISCAATIGPTPGSSSSAGTVARTRARISRSSRLASSVATSMRWASERSATIVASRSGVRELERRKRLQRRTSSPTGSRRSSCRSISGAVTITLPSWTSATRRTSTALLRASSSTRNASCCCPERGIATVSLASAVRAARTASSGSSLPRRRRSPRLVRATSWSRCSCRVR